MYGPAFLAYAGPYSSSPSTAFGHLFLVLANKPTDPSPLWDVVAFTAVTFDVDPVRYVTVGVLGGFLGRFSRQKLHQKSREYQLLEDRDVWFVELRLTIQERRMLEAALTRAAGRWYPYDFFGRNCAYYLQALLAQSTNAMEPPSGISSPTGVMTRVLRTAVAGRTYFRPSVSGRLATMGAAASPGVVARLAGESWRASAADTAWVASLLPADRRVVQELIHLRAAEASEAFEPAIDQGIARLRLLAAERSPIGRQEAAAGREIPSPIFHRYARVRAGYTWSRSVATRLSLQWRGALHDELDPWFAHRPVSTMELLSAEVSSPANEFAPRLESAIVFSQRSVVPSTWVKSRRSWMGELQLRRGGVLSRDLPHGELRAGLGHARRLPLETYAYALATVAGVTTLRRGALAPGAELGIVSIPSTRVRLGARWSREHDAGSWTHSHERFRGWARLDLSSQLGVTMTGGRAGRIDSSSLTFDWYP